MSEFTHRKATIDDLPKIIQLLVDDELGQNRESASVLNTNYLNAFNKINNDINQYLMVVENHQDIVATCHLTLMPSLTFMGATRMQIEAVRVDSKYRGQKIGTWMIEQAILYAQQHNASIVQLTTHKSRSLAKKFYETCGFVSSHEGMKLSLNKV